MKKYLLLFLIIASLTLGACVKKASQNQIETIEETPATVYSEQALVEDFTKDQGLSESSDLDTIEKELENTEILNEDFSNL